MISSIITHPGGAHKDDFLACAVLLKNNPVSIYRREPTKDDLKNNSIAVLDVGGVYEPGVLILITISFHGIMNQSVLYH